MGELRAGVAQLPITPPVGVDLTGFVAREQPSIGVHDELFVRALYLENEEDRLLWLHCDLLALGREQVARTRQAVGESLGLEPRQVLLTATHTHSGPATVPLRQCGMVDPVYLRMLDGWLLTASRCAVADHRPVTLRFAEERCTLAQDRRPPSLLAHTDHRLPVLSLVNDKGNYVAVIANYPMHNVALSAENRLISADMAGAAAEWARQRLPGAPVVLMTNGACGNLNPPSLSADPHVMESYGRQLGEVILRGVHDGESALTPLLGTNLQTVALPLTILSQEAVLAEYNRLAKMVILDRRQAAMREWRDDTLALLEQGTPPDEPWTAPIDIQVLRIGPVRFAALGAEVFSRMADELRAIHGPHTYVVGYANGDTGYLPFREAYPEGGYEVETAYKFYANFMVAPGSYELCRDTAVELLLKLG
jgi:neutral ceramidase